MSTFPSKGIDSRKLLILIVGLLFDSNFLLFLLFKVGQLSISKGKPIPFIGEQPTWGRLLNSGELIGSASKFRLGRYLLLSWLACLWRNNRNRNIGIELLFE